jgi:hypothetical protein
MKSVCALLVALGFLASTTAASQRAAAPKVRRRRKVSERVTSSSAAARSNPMLPLPVETSPSTRKSSASTPTSNGK